MDPATLIATALVSGAAAETTDSAAAAARDMYVNLRTAVRHRMAGYPSQVNLNGLKTGSERRDRLAAVLSAAGVDADAKVVAMAQQLMALLDPRGARQGGYVVDLHEAKGVQVGDDNLQVNQF